MHDAGSSLWRSIGIVSMSEYVLPASRGEWLAIRERLLTTASRVAAFLVAHPYTSPLREYQIAVGEATRNDGYDEVNEDLVDLGNLAEMVMPARIAAVRPDLPPVLKNEGLFLHRTLRFGGTPDFLDEAWMATPAAERQGPPAVCIQGKCVHPMAWRSSWAEGPPEHVLVQHQAEYLLTGARVGGVFALVRDADWTSILYDVEPHDGVMAAIAEAVEMLTDAVERRSPPPPDWLADAAWIEHRQAKPRKKTLLDLSHSNSFRDACARFLAADIAAKEADKAKTAARAEIIAAFGDAEIVTAGPFTAKRTAVAENPGTVITADMVGQVINARAGHVRLSIKEEG